MAEPSAFINAIAGTVPPHDVHRLFIDWAESQIEDPRLRKLFMRMADRSGIEHRWSVLPPAPGGLPHDRPGGFYHGDSPATSMRMECYAEAAPELALEAIGKLAGQVDLDGVTHLVVASCTGFVAPGIDQIIARRLGLEGVERTLVGFMGCYAAVSALRVAHHIVRSEPKARVLAVTVELCSLHLQHTQQLEQLLAMLQFSDGAAAALVTSEPGGFEMSHLFSAQLEESAELIQWKIVDTGFEMTLSGEVPNRINAALQDEDLRATLYNGWAPDEVDSWAVHAGGRSILDAVEKGLELPQGSLFASRDILARFGNMSSSTLMFVLAELLGRSDVRKGVALAFGPGLAAEGFHFSRAGAGPLPAVA
ncbi:type III polyketide synthase [Sphingosinicella sp. CPCC 101087]|uniref:type III polyketide synthase n=1 Tax=Sphingosinicella sp. CPCC 101087 TaxID=2497754 RepID=UPI00101D3169|nr:type III polyketide synthase [Sphingosinicella sp. CPCC 101087]